MHDGVNLNLNTITRKKLAFPRVLLIFESGDNDDDDG